MLRSSTRDIARLDARCLTFVLLKLICSITSLAVAPPPYRVDLPIETLRSDEYKVLKVDIGDNDVPRVQRLATSGFIHGPEGPGNGGRWFRSVGIVTRGCLSPSRR